MSARAGETDTEDVVDASGLLLGRDRELEELCALVDGIDEQGAYDTPTLIETLAR